MLKITDTFDWEITYKTRNSKLIGTYSDSNITFESSRDEEHVTLLYVKASTTEFNLNDAREKAFEKVNAILDAYSVLTGINISIEYFSYNLLNKPKLPPGTVLLLPSTSRSITITVLAPINGNELRKSKNLSFKIKSRKDALVFNKIFSWYRKGLSSRDPYNHFIYVWIAFNALYNLFSKQRYEKDKINDLMKWSVKKQDIKPILLKHANDLDTLSKANIYSKNRKINYSKKIEDNMNKKDYDSAIINAVFCIYEVRCDIFHGEEKPSVSSRKLVESSYSILDELLRNFILVIA